MTQQRNIFGTALSSVIVLLGTLVSGVIVARILGPEGRGEYGILILATQLGFGAGTLSLFDALVIIGKKRLKPDRYIPSLLVFSPALIGLTLLFSLVLVSFLGETGVTTWSLVFLILAYMVVETVNRLLYSIELANGEYKNINRERAVASLGYVVISLALLAFDISLAIVAFAGFLLSKLPIFLMRVWRFRRALQGRINRPFLRSIIAKGSRLHLPYSLSLMAAQIDKILIAAFFPTDLFGLYLVCQSAVAAIFSPAIQVISLMALPEFSGRDRYVAQLRFEKAFRLVAFFSILLVAITALIVPYLIPLVYGEEFRRAVTFIAPVAVLTVSLALRTLIVEYMRSQELWRAQIGFEISIIVLGLATAVAAKGSVQAFLMITSSGYILAIICILWYLSAIKKLLLPTSLRPSMREAAGVMRIAWDSLIARIVR